MWNTDCSSHLSVPEMMESYNLHKLSRYIALQILADSLFVSGRKGIYCSDCKNKMIINKILEAKGYQIVLHQFTWNISFMKGFCGYDIRLKRPLGQ